MNVEVAPYATPSRCLPPTPMGIPQEYPNLLLVNGKQASPETVLKDGETLAIFPPLAGG